MTRLPKSEILASHRFGRLGLLKAVAGAFITIKLFYILFAGPIADEAYYWLWGQNPGLSYFDHPPLQAWLLGLSDAVFGRSLLSLRWLTLVTLALTFYLYHVWAKKIAGPNWPALFWPGAVIYLASPTFGFFTSLAMHDYLLVCLALISGHFFLSYLVAFVEGQRPRVVDLYLGALFLGLVGLTKYSGVLFGVGLLFFILATPKLRGLLRNPHLYLAALLAIAMQFPILIWNAQADFASFRYHLSDRHPEDWLSRINLMAFAEFVLVSLLLISPFLAVAFARFLLARPKTAFERTARGLGLWVFWTSTGLFLAVSLFDRVWWWWNLLAYVLLLPFAAKYMQKRWLFWGHVAWGAVIQLFLLISSTIVPLQVVFGFEDPLRSSLYGWEQLEAPVRAAEAAHQTGFVATMTSEVAGVLAFSLDDAKVTALTPVLNQFDYWFEPLAHLGQDAVVVLRDDIGRDFVERQFQSLRPLQEIPIVRFGFSLGTYQLYLGDNYAPQP